MYNTGYVNVFGYHADIVIYTILKGYTCAVCFQFLIILFINSFKTENTWKVLKSYKSGANSVKTNIF